MFSPKPRRHLRWIIASLWAAVIGCFALFFWRVFTERVVLEAVSQRGDRLWVTQKFLDGDIWFNTRIITLDTNGTWRWHYYDHEDDFWFLGSAREGADGTISLMRTGDVAAKWFPLTHQIHRAKGDLEDGMVTTNVPRIIRTRAGLD